MPSPSLIMRYTYSLCRLRPTVLFLFTSEQAHGLKKFTTFIWEYRISPVTIWLTFSPHGEFYSRGSPLFNPSVFKKYLPVWIGGPRKVNLSNQTIDIKTHNWCQHFCHITSTSQRWTALGLGNMAIDKWYFALATRKAFSSLGNSIYNNYILTNIHPHIKYLLSRSITK